MDGSVTCWFPVKHPLYSLGIRFCGHHAYTWNGVGQRDDAGGDHVEQVGDGEVRHQPVVDRSKKTIAGEHDQGEAVDQHRQRSNNTHHGRHHVITARRM